MDHEPHGLIVSLEYGLQEESQRRSNKAVMLLPSINIPKLKIGQTSPRALALLGVRERESSWMLSVFISFLQYNVWI